MLYLTNGPPSHSGPRFITLNVVEGGSQRKYFCKISFAFIIVIIGIVFYNCIHPFLAPTLGRIFDNKFLNL